MMASSDSVGASASSARERKSLDQPELVHDEHPKKHDINLTSNVNAKLENPLRGIPQDKLFAQVDEFCDYAGLTEHKVSFRKGALIAQRPLAFENLDVLDEEDKKVLRRERDNRWSIPFQMYWLVILCSMAAVVQGMDEAVVNGANFIYQVQFGLDSGSNRDNLIYGLVNSAPYLCSATVGCWMTDPLNRLCGRRGAIFISTFIAGAASIWEAVTNSWQNLFAARFVLGLGIGPKSATVPVYAAETSPKNIRGALVMMWQVWTAFGIMLGYVVDIAFYFVPDSGGIVGLNWRLMLGSTVVAPIIVCSQVYTCPESPRWLMGRKRYVDAFRSLQRLRNSDMEAARDLYYMHVLLELESEVTRGKNLLREMFTIPRNRRAALASWIVMFMQQFCGINVIAYYSTSIFRDAGYSEVAALAAALGTGVLNFGFALPAFYTIDTFGRRNLLLVTYPLMGLCLLLCGFSFWIPAVPGYPTVSYNKTDQNLRTGFVALGMYLFEIAYSPGEGPVPFTYSAECYPLYIRDLGMSFATATTWLFNFVLAFSWPAMLSAFKPQGAFGWYAAWNFIGWFGVLMFVPETKALSLEELDQVFGVPTWKHASYQLKTIPYWWKKYIRRQRITREPLYHFNNEDDSHLYEPSSSHTLKARNMSVLDDPEKANAAHHN